MRDDGPLLIRLPDPTLETHPGGRAAVRAEVANAGDHAVRVRLRVTGRAAAWLEPADGADVLDLPAQAVRSVTLVARPPAAGRHDALVPFTVHLDGPDARASATGLVVLAPDRTVAVAITPSELTARRTAHLSVEVRGDPAVGVVGLAPSPHARLRVWLAAPTVTPLPDAPATTALTVRAVRPTFLTTVRHEVRVGWQVLGDVDARGTARTVLRQQPLLPVPLTAALLVVLLLGVVVGARTLLGRDPLPFGLLGERTPAAASSAAPPVEPAWVQLGAVPHGTDPEAAHVVAQEQADGLRAAGVPRVRVVDGADLPGTAPAGEGFWVLVVDGFADDDAAADFCRTYEDLPDVRCLPGS